MEKKYRALRLISTVIKVFAWIALIGGILGAIAVLLIGIFGGGIAIGGASSEYAGMMGATSVVGGILASVAILIGAVLLFVIDYAMSEFIDVQIAIEQNTREAAYFLSGGQAPMGGMPPMR